MHKQVNCAPFEPVFTLFGPFGLVYAPSFTVGMYLRAILWSRVELEGCRLEDIFYYTPLPLNLANKQASKQASNKHFSFPLWPLLRLIAPCSTVL